MGWYALKRSLQAVPVLLALATVTFFLVRWAPGGPFSEERRVPPEVLARLQAYYGLDRPLLEQYGRYLWQLCPKRLDPRPLLRGELDLRAVAGIDLGYSYRMEGRSVNELIAGSFPASLQIGALALLLALALGLPAGVGAAAGRDRWPDHLAMGLSLGGICLPTFVLGPLLALGFGLHLGWFNVMGWAEWSDRVLPAVTLGLFYAAYVARIVRGGLLEVLGQDYIRTARAKGLPERVVLWKHALKGGLLPLVNFLGPAAAGLITGSFVVETVFQVPGLGRHFVNAAFNRDYTLILGTVLFYGLLLVFLNLLVDLVQALLNPRLRYD